MGTRFYVTAENVEEVISKMKDIYTIDDTYTLNTPNILAFFGGWNDEGWVFESEWFEDGFESFEDLCVAFEDWLYEQ